MTIRTQPLSTHDAYRPCRCNACDHQLGADLARIATRERATREANRAAAAAAGECCAFVLFGCDCAVAR